MALTNENIAQRARDLITSDDESVWLDLPQIINVIRPALSAFFDDALKSASVRAMFPTEKLTFTVTAGEADLTSMSSYVLGIIGDLEVFLNGWNYPVDITETREQLNLGSITNGLYLRAYKQASKLIFSTDTVGAFGNGTINGVSGTIHAPKVALDVTNLPELLEGKFVAFLADFVKDQILKRN